MFLGATAAKVLATTIYNFLYYCFADIHPYAVVVKRQPEKHDERNG